MNAQKKKEVTRRLVATSKEKGEKFLCVYAQAAYRLSDE